MLLSEKPHLTIREGVREISGSLKYIKREVESNPGNRYYLVEVIGNGRVIYKQEIASSQPRVLPVCSENISLSFETQNLTDKELECVHFLKADVYVSRWENQAKN